MAQLWPLALCSNKAAIKVSAGAAGTFWGRICLQLTYLGSWLELVHPGLLGSRSQVLSGCWLEPPSLAVWVSPWVQLASHKEEKE